MENKVFQQQIKERTGWSDAIVRFLHSREEAEVYIKAGLVERRIGGRAALVRTDIDWRAFNCRQEWLKEKFADWDKWQDYNNADLIGEGCHTMLKTLFGFVDKGGV